MDDIGVIDRFLNIFSAYIDTGFGLLNGEIRYLTATLIAIDITIAGLVWAWKSNGAEEVIAALVKKTIYIGAFAFILTNFNVLANILLRSFAGLGLIAGGSGLTAADLLRPGRLAAVGIDAARPIAERMGHLIGPVDFFVNFDEILVLSIAWLLVILAFFFLAVQIFVTLIEFKLTTLAGFVLVPFGLCGKTAFLAERVLGNVISSGIKVLVLAVIVGIGIGIFAEFTAPVPDYTVDHALATLLGALALFGLGLFGPGIATGLVSGAPQLGAGAAAGTALAAGGITAAGVSAAAGGARLATAVGGAVLRSSGQAATAGIQAAKGGAQAFRAGAAASGASGAKAAAHGFANVARVGVQAAAQRIRGAAGSMTSRAGASTPAAARQTRTRQVISQGLSTAAHIIRNADHGGGGGANPSLKG